MSLEDYQRKLAYILYPTVFEDLEHYKKRVIEYRDITDRYNEIIEEYDELLRWLTYPKQEEDVIISNDELKQILVEQLGENVKSVTTIPDSKFKLVNREHLQQWLYKNPVNKRKYVPTWHDCNTFATILKGDLDKWDSQLCTGEVYVITEEGSGHAVNIFVDLNKDVYIIEPQNDSIFKFPDNWKVYSKLDF